MTHEHPKNEKYICKLKIKIKACFNFKENQNEPTDDKKKSSKLLTTKFMKKKKKNSSDHAGLASSKDKQSQARAVED